MKINVSRLKTPIQNFFALESASGILLIVATIVALIVANSPLGGLYFDALAVKFKFQLANLVIDKPILLWINDGLMAIFFLLIGLEVKRELLYGELSSFKSALTPVVAAIGGVAIPGIFYLIFNFNTEFVKGWAIPTATDIAFAVGILTLLGSRVPLWAKVFLTALAVMDDIIAIVIISIYFTDSLQMVALWVVAACVIVLIVLNRLEVKKLAPYIFVGIILWIATLKSGIHATIAGVVLGFTIPAIRERKDTIINSAEKGLDLLKASLNSSDTKGQLDLRNSALMAFDDVVNNSLSPLHRLEHWLHPWVAYLIIPIFALANAGVAINADVFAKIIGSSLFWGIVLGLFAGKQLGIFGLTWLLSKMRFSNLIKSKQDYWILYGVACLAGIGFTMSIFIAGLSFSKPDLLDQSKLAILIGSFLSAIWGFVILKIKLPRNR